MLSMFDTVATRIRDKKKKNKSRKNRTRGNQSGTEDESSASESEESSGGQDVGRDTGDRQQFPRTRITDHVITDNRSRQQDIPRNQADHVVKGTRSQQRISGARTIGQAATAPAVREERDSVVLEDDWETPQISVPGSSTAGGRSRKSDDKIKMVDVSDGWQGSGKTDTRMNIPVTDSHQSEYRDNTSLSSSDQATDSKKTEGKKTKDRKKSKKEKKMKKDKKKKKRKEKKELQSSDNLSDDTDLKLLTEEPRNEQHQGEHETHQGQQQPVEVENMKEKARKEEYKIRTEQVINNQLRMSQRLKTNSNNNRIVTPVERIQNSDVATAQVYNSQPSKQMSPVPNNTMIPSLERTHSPNVAAVQLFNSHPSRQVSPVPSSLSRPHPTNFGSEQGRPTSKVVPWTTRNYLDGDNPSNFGRNSRTSTASNRNWASSRLAPEGGSGVSQYFNRYDKSYQSNPQLHHTNNTKQITGYAGGARYVLEDIKPIQNFDRSNRKYQSNPNIANANTKVEEATVRNSMRHFTPTPYGAHIAHSQRSNDLPSLQANRAPLPLRANNPVKPPVPPSRPPSAVSQHSLTAANTRKIPLPPPVSQLARPASRQVVAPAGHGGQLHLQTFTGGQRHSQAVQDIAQRPQLTGHSTSQPNQNWQMQQQQQQQQHPGGGQQGLLMVQHQQQQYQNQQHQQLPSGGQQGLLMVQHQEQQHQQLPSGGQQGLLMLQKQSQPSSLQRYHQDPQHHEDLNQLSYYRTEISRLEAEDLLKDHGWKNGGTGDGSFLVRPSQTLPNELVLSVLVGLEVKHFVINKSDQGKFYLSLVKDEAFPTLSSLIQHLQQRGIKDGKYRLITPLPATARLHQNIPSQQAASDQWQIEQHHLKIDGELGRGRFGVVYRGILGGETIVAVKTIADAITGSPGAYENFQREIQVLKSLRHPRLTRLLGVTTLPTNGMTGIIMEYLINGNLLEYLLDVRTWVFTLKDNKKTAFGVEVAEGMAYLESQRVVHRDLAARNVLLSEDMTVKIADFGLSRFLQNDVETVHENSHRPLRWMALESLRTDRFSSKSDVWSYGVLLLEIYTLGECPYNSYEDHEIIPLLERGERAPQPKNCPDKVYDEIMSRCWDANLDNRPSFFDILYIWSNINKK